MPERWVSSSISSSLSLHSRFCPIFCDFYISKQKLLLRPTDLQIMRWFVEQMVHILGCEHHFVTILWLECTISEASVGHLLCICRCVVSHLTLETTIFAPLLRHLSGVRGAFTQEFIANSLCHRYLSLEFLWLCIGIPYAICAPFKI